MGQFTYQSITTLVTRGSPVSGVKVKVIPSVSVNPVWPSHQTLGIDPMLASYWPTVYDVGPTINQHWVSVSCFLSYQSINWCTEKLALSYLSTALIGWSESTGDKLTGSVGVCYWPVWVTRSVRGCFGQCYFSISREQVNWVKPIHHFLITHTTCLFPFHCFWKLGVLFSTTGCHATYWEFTPRFRYWSLTIKALNYFCMKGFYSFWNHHKCLS